MAEDALIEVGCGVDVETIERALENGRKQIKHNVGGALGHLSWPMVRESLAVAIRDEIGKGLMPWLASAWTTARELHQFKDREAYPPGTESFYDMVPQSVDGSIHPQISIRCAGAEVGSLRFDVTVAADFHSLALIIRDAAIIGFGGGDYEISLRIRLEGHDLSGPITLEKSRLPGRMRFGRGLPIV